MSYFIESWTTMSRSHDFFNSMNSNRLTDANFFFKWGPNDRVEHNVGHVTA